MADPDPTPSVTVERTGPETYTARNDRGAEIRIGSRDAEGVFSPVELLQVAVAGCSALSAEAQLASRLGEDFAVTATVDALLNQEENRIEQIITRISTDMSGLTPEDRDKLTRRAERVISRLCTVKRTLGHGTENVVEVRAED